MLRDDASLLDIYLASQDVLSYAQTLTASELAADEMRLSAILYKMMIIGEATKRLSDAFRVEHPEIPWKSMAGVRDILAHQYDEVKIDLLEKAIRVSIPETLEKIAPLLPQAPS